MKPSILALFPGQGSQEIAMGRELCENSELAEAYFATAGRLLGIDLRKICLEGPKESLTATAIAQPAILTVSSICFELAREKKLPIACAAGHSLGEYSALVAAKALSFEDAVQLVHKRGRYMQEAVAVGAGKMVAILGTEISAIEGAIAQVESGTVQIANDNSPGQVVVAGDVTGISNLQKILANSRMIELNVSAPFHCALMANAEAALRKDLATLTISPAEFPVISNFYAKELSSTEEIREALALQVCGRVRWVESITYATSRHAISSAIEFGHGTVLTGLLRRIAPQVTRQSLSTTAEIAAII